MCQHAGNLSLPKPSTTIYKEECTLCFDSQDSVDGIDVCLTCYNGSCPDQHTLLHCEKKRHYLYLNIKRNKIEGERPEKITKLEIGHSEDKYDYVTRIDEFGQVTKAVMDAMSARKRSDIKAWEEETLQPCYHCDLKQHDGVQVSTLAHCKQCELKENLWLCLTCGNLGCGRAQYGGLGGNGHALVHFQTSGHPVAVKMGSITPEGTADVFCYEHGNEITNPNLATHLAHFGINILQQEKTQKSLAELQLEQNMKFDFSMTTADGKEMEALFGPGLTGLKNLGNSCYLASVMQVLFSIPHVQETYFVKHQMHIQNCYEFPADCFHCQMGKLADGLLSGRYSVALIGDENESRGQDGIAPAMLKTVVGKGHPEFATMRQQDAQEFFQHMLNMMEQKEKPMGTNSTKACTFQMESRLQCLECEKVQYKSNPFTSLILPVPAIRDGETEDGKVRYQPVQFLDMMEKYFEADMREFNCPTDKTKTMASYISRFGTFPEILVCVASRFVLGEGWVMEKLNVKINTPLEFSLDHLKSLGIQEGEVAFPADAVGSGEPQVDQDALNQLLGMGFPENRCKKAIIKTGNNGAEVAMNWLFEHMEDPDIDEPVIADSSSAGISDAELAPLMDMGFSRNQALRAMKETNNNMERAVDWLFSHPEVGDDPVVEEQSQNQEPDNRPAKYQLFALISHKGTSAQCGHYVSYIKKGNDWVLFNDNKVVKVPDIMEASQEAYVYVFQRV